MPRGKIRGFPKPAQGCLYLIAAALCLSAGIQPAYAFDACKDKSHYIPVEQRYETGLLFKVEQCGAPVSYVFGTIHLARPEITRAARAAFLLLSQVDAAGFELAESEEEIEALAAKDIMRPPGATPSLEQELGSVRYAKLLMLLKGTALQPAGLQRLKPWAIAVAMEFIGEKPGRVLDEQIRTAALKLGKPIFGLEKPQEQSDIFDAMPEAMQVRMLKESIDHYSEFVGLKHASIEAYLQSDARKISALERQSMSVSEDPEFDAFLNDHLLVKRNRTMEQRLLPHIKRHSVLVSLGVMHLLGEDGILRLLEQDGYYITPMP